MATTYGWAEHDPLPRPQRSRALSLAAGSQPLTAMHYTIVATDIAGFSDRRRKNSNQVRVRRGFYDAMRYGFDAARIPWEDCHREDRGDGALLLAPADVPKTQFVDVLPDALAEALTAHNDSHPVEEQIRLRLALHAGEILHDEHGFAASSINHTFRILDADAVKAKFAASAGVLALISSAWFFEEVIWHSERSRADSFDEVDVINKETATRAWIRLVGAVSAGRRPPRWRR